MQYKRGDRLLIVYAKFQIQFDADFPTAILQWNDLFSKHTAPLIVYDVLIKKAIYCNPQL